MKENKDIEQILLNGEEYEKMVKAKIEQEFNAELEKSSSNSDKKFITEIKEVPNDKLFSKAATFEVINKDSKTKSYINGLQAEGYLGIQNSDRIKLLAGETDSFVSGNSYVKFVKVRI
ncbi:hypothetical protein IJ541_10605 [bacterium]|nr:hypothetical protein [bacterium]